MTTASPAHHTLASPSLAVDFTGHGVSLLDGNNVEVLNTQRLARIRFNCIDCQAMRAIRFERPAELLIPPAEVDDKLCPNEKMVDESRFFSGHVWGGMDKPF